MIVTKSFRDISLPITEDEYRADGAMHYSTLAKFARGGFACIPTLNDRIESPSLTFGSCVDSIITGGVEEFQSRFMVSEKLVLSDTMAPIAKQLFDECHESYDSLDDVPDELIAQIGKENNYYANDKYKNTRIKNIREGCADYYRLRFLAGDRTLITAEQYQDVVNSVRALKTSPSTRWFFQDDTDDGIERLYQLKFITEYKGINYSNMADLIVVDHNKKRVYPVDLKTSSHTEYDFFKSFIDWSYHIQARQYWRIIRATMDKDPYFKDFELMDYRFIVVNKRTLTPLVWIYEDTRKYGTLYYGKNNQIECKDPYDLGAELHHYLHNAPVVPLGVNLTGDNSITQWLKTI